MSCTFQEFEFEMCLSYRNLGFMIFSFFRRRQNSNCVGDKTSIFIDKVYFTLHPRIRLIDTNTNAKEQHIYIPV